MNRPPELDASLSPVTPAQSTRRTPRTSAAVLAEAAGLSFRPTTRDRSGSTLGVLVDMSGAQHHLVIADDGAWTLSSGSLPAGRKPVLLYESAANVLRGGAANPDGSISYQGGLYAIESSFDGKSWTAKVSGCS
jgi:hypothetical protein